MARISGVVEINRQFRGGASRANEETLAPIASDCHNALQLWCRLHTFGGDSHIERVRERGNRPHDCAVTHVAIEPVN
jgi:hypothetical protein